MILKILFKMRNSIHLFWNQYPALRFAVFFLIGIGTTFHLGYILLGIILLFERKWVYSLLMIGAGYFYCLLLHSDPNITEPISGSGIFHIEQIKRHSTPFKPLLAYEGTLRIFQTKNQTFYRLPCCLYMATQSNRPLATQDYFLSHVSLKKRSSHRFILKTNKNSLWTPCAYTKSQAEWRFQTKEKVRHWVKKNFHQPSVQQLIISLLTGQKESRLQIFQFSQIGLQHLLAISGFHFAILTFFLAFLLRRLLPQKPMVLILICLLSCYFYYMGNAPSISRAWMGVIVFLGGIFFQRKNTSLNALGVGLLAALISNPLIIMDIGFQLSFAATFSILAFYTFFELKLQQLFPKRNLQILKKLSLYDQWGCLLSTYLRKVLALNLSVLIFTFPILLVHFHKFPLISLIYNLFFPFLFTLLLSLLLVSLLFPFLIPFLTTYSAFLLKLVSYAPKRLMFCLRFSEFPKSIACLICLLLFLWAAYLHWSSSTIKEWDPL